MVTETTAVPVVVPKHSVTLSLLAIFAAVLGTLLAYVGWFFAAIGFAVLAGGSPGRQEPSLLVVAGIFLMPAWLLGRWGGGHWPFRRLELPSGCRHDSPLWLRLLIVSLAVVHLVCCVHACSSRKQSHNMYYRQSTAHGEQPYLISEAARQFVRERAGWQTQNRVIFKTVRVSVIGPNRHVVFGKAMGWDSERHDMRTLDWTTEQSWDENTQQWRMHWVTLK